MSTPVKTLSFLIVPTVAIAALILVLAISSAGGQTEPAGGTAVEARDLASGMRALAREIEALRMALGKAPEPGREALPAASAAEPPSSFATEQVTRDLERVIDQLAARSGSLASVTSHAVVAAPAEAHPERIAALRHQPEAERSRAHFFWTYQQVLDRYGMPDSIYHSPDGLLTWYYQTDADSQLGFGFFDGYVIQVSGG
jgi:hypothetical protein